MQIFPRSTNAISRASLFVPVFALAGLFWVLAQLQRSPYITYAGVRKSQPVPFSHQHHVTGLGIDCRYCHTSVEQSGFAGIPPTKTCMNCHSQIWTNATMLEPVRASYRTGESLQWTDGVVPQLPSCAGKISAPARAGIQHALPTTHHIVAGTDRRHQLYRPGLARFSIGEDIPAAYRAGHHEL